MGFPTQIFENDKFKDQNTSEIVVRTSSKIFPINLKKTVNVDSTVFTNNFKKEDNETIFFKNEEIVKKIQSDSSLKIRTTKRNKIKNLTFMKIERFKKAKKILDISNRQPKINFNIFEYIILFFKRLFHLKISEKEKLFLKGVDIYDNELDIVGILRKLQEIEKMKIILFNKDQLILFNLLEKPLISLTGNENIERLSTLSPSRQMSEMIRRNNKIDPEHLKKALEYFDKLKSSGQMSDIDKKLTDLVDTNINQF